MAKRLLDVLLAGAALIGLAPLFALTAIAIRLVSPGPVLYRGLRVGQHGRPFRMLKFRTMHANGGPGGSAITAHHDPRVFPLGRWLRRAKIDELPQLVNVLRGEMSIVGPRPEDPKFVEAHYGPVDRETLTVRPGLASPGSIYNYTHGESVLVGDDPERRYVEQLLRLKLALDVVYVRRASLGYDVAIIGRTVTAILGTMLGRRRFGLPPEFAAAGRLLAPPHADTPALLRRLSQELRIRGIPHCQWKGHWKRGRWTSGEGDLDLLVEAGAADATAALLARLGFHQARAAPDLELPESATYFGWSCEGGPLLHVHVHYRLVIGEPWRILYHLPLESLLLASAVPSDPFSLPRPELEYALFVIRSALRHRLRDTRPGGGRWIAALQDELAYLEQRIELGTLQAFLAEYLPAVPFTLFLAARASLGPAESSWSRARAARRLHRALRSRALAVSFAQRVRVAFHRARWLGGRLGSGAGRRRLASNGGRLVALDGADGAGKSTCARELREWLGRHLAVMAVHMGRPPRSLLTLCVGALLKVRNGILGSRPDVDAPGAPFPGYVALLRLVCTARDRYRLYCRAARFARAGGITLSERHPLPQNRALVGPGVGRFVPIARQRWVAARLSALEQRYYERIRAPDVVLVLYVDPDRAVRRKTDEPSDYVRRRAEAMAHADWTGAEAVVIDANQPLPTVLGELKRAIWARL